MENDTYPNYSLYLKKKMHKNALSIPLRYEPRKTK